MCRRVRRLIVSGLTCAFVLAGCGLAGPTLYPISGIVLHNGQPVPEAEVVLTSESGSPKASTSGTAVTDHEGRFTIESGTRQDGLPKGRYRIRVAPPNWRMPMPNEDHEPAPPDPTDNTPAGVIPFDYRTEDTTPLRLDLTGPVTDFQVDVSVK